MKVTSRLVAYGAALSLLSCNVSSENQHRENASEKHIKADVEYSEFEKAKFFTKPGSCQDSKLGTEEKRKCGTLRHPIESLYAVDVYPDEFRKYNIDKYRRRLDRLVKRSVISIYLSRPDNFMQVSAAALKNIEGELEPACLYFSPDGRIIYRATGPSIILIKTYIWIAYRRYLVDHDMVGYHEAVNSAVKSRCWSSFRSTVLSSDVNEAINKGLNTGEISAALSFYHKGYNRDDIAWFFWLNYYLDKFHEEALPPAGKAPYLCIAEKQNLKTPDGSPFDYRDKSEVLGWFRSKCAGVGGETLSRCIASLKECGVSIK